MITDDGNDDLLPSVLRLRFLAVEAAIFDDCVPSSL